MKKTKSGAINNPGTAAAAASWRLMAHADARQPGLGGQVAFKIQEARLSLPLWSLSPSWLLHSWVSPLTRRTSMAALGGPQ